MDRGLGHVFLNSGLVEVNTVGDGAGQVALAKNAGLTGGVEHYEGTDLVVGKVLPCGAQGIVGGHADYLFRGYFVDSHRSSSLLVFETPIQGVGQNRAQRQVPKGSNGTAAGAL